MWFHSRLAAGGLLAEGQAVGLVGNRRVGLQGGGSGGGGRPSRGGSADIALGSLLLSAVLAVLAGLAGLAGLSSLSSLSRGCGVDLALRVGLGGSGGGHLGGRAGDVPDVEVGALGGDLGGRDRVELAGRGAGVGGEAKDEGLAGGVGLAGLLAELGGGDGGLAERGLGAGGGGGDVAAVSGQEGAGEGGGGHGGEDDDVLEGRHFVGWVGLESWCE